MKNITSSNVAISYNSQITYDQDVVHQMISEVFHLLKLDEEHYNTPSWNPLGEYICPGNKVLIKPNLVMHINPSGEGSECLYTQATVVRAIIEYVIIALNGIGSIIVGDAPMQQCHFDKLIEESGYKALIEEYQKQGINITLRDFRNTISETINGIVVEKEKRQNDGILVNLGEYSSFASLSEKHIKNLRVTNYDPRILQEHHTFEKHEYLIAQEILDADVIINVPKPKTHRKAGMTGALKNLVGISCNKEYLPHHTRQSNDIHGDAFFHKDIFLRLTDEYMDKKYIATQDQSYIRAKIYKYISVICRYIGQKRAHEKFSEGSWYGNDTIWRTIHDLNKIVQYVDKNGKLCNERQRKLFNIGDMIISGENDGPLRPSCKEVGIIIASEDSCSFDEVISALMGFDSQKIPTIKYVRKALPQLYLESTYTIISNNPNWNGKDLKNIRNNYNVKFVPSPFWKDALCDADTYYKNNGNIRERN